MATLTTYRVRDLGYDGNLRDNPWYDITAEDWPEAVAMALEVDRRRVAFTEPVAPMSSIHAVYARCPTGGYTKIGCVQFSK